MHLGFYVRHHTLDDNGEVGGLTLLLPPIGTAAGGSGVRPPR